MGNNNLKNVLGVEPEASISFSEKEGGHTGFKELFFSHDDHVSDKWENYLDIYETHFRPFVGKNSNILEIGVQNGGSLQIASKYFINGNIYGIDIEPKVCAMNLGSNIKTYCFDIKNRDEFNRNFSDMKFDVILDDASHRCSDIIEAFKILFSKLNPGGVYAIEDTHTSYWEFYEGGYLKKATTIEFFKKFIDLLHAYHIEKADRNFIQNLSELDTYVLEWLESIVFYDSVIVIKKVKMPRKHSYRRVMTGDIQPVMDIKSSFPNNNNYADLKSVSGMLFHEQE